MEMIMGDKMILVVGATGQQGGAVARRLLAAGWKVRILTRDLDKHAVQLLRQSGAEAIQGHLDDAASLEQALYDVYGAFSFQPILSYEDELRQGKAIADAACNAGVKHFVYSSVGGAEGQSAYRNIAKWNIEQHVRTLSMPYTILRPAAFMEDIISPRFGMPNGKFSIPINEDVEIPLISIDDIGSFVNIAFEQPERFLGKTIEIAGDSLVPTRIAEIVSSAIGRPISYEPVPLEIVRQHSETVAKVYEFYNETGYEVDIPSLRNLYPGLLSFNAWMEKVGISTLVALSN